MNTTLSLPLISSLAISSTMLFASSAQSATILFTNTTGSDATVGYSFIYTGLDGRPLNIISSESPEFPTTLIENNNTPEVSVTRIGAALPANTPYSVESVIEDYPDGTFGYNTLKAVALVATPTGIEERNIGAFNFFGTTSPNATTPFSAVQITTDVEINGTIYQRQITAQLPGDKISISGFAIPDDLTVNISSKPISGYVPFDQLGAFPASTPITLVPGGTVDIITQEPPESVPEPSITLFSLSVISLGAFLKRKPSQL